MTRSQKKSRSRTNSTKVARISKTAEEVNYGQRKWLIYDKCCDIH